jgi:hypothetical protein
MLNAMKSCFARKATPTTTYILVIEFIEIDVGFIAQEITSAFVKG